MPFKETLFRDEFWVWQYKSNELLEDMGLAPTHPELWFIKRFNVLDTNERAPLRIGTSYLCGEGGIKYWSNIRGCETILSQGIKTNLAHFIANNIRSWSSTTNWNNFIKSEWNSLETRDPQKNSFKIAYIYSNNTFPVPSASPTLATNIPTITSISPTITTIIPTIMTITPTITTNIPTITTSIPTNVTNTTTKHKASSNETLFIIASIIVGSLAVLMSLIGYIHAACIHKNDLFRILSIIVPFIHLYVKYIFIF